MTEPIKPLTWETITEALEAEECNIRMFHVEEVREVERERDELREALKYAKSGYRLYVYENKEKDFDDLLARNAPETPCSECDGSGQFC